MKDNNKVYFPEIKKKIESFMYEEDGNITRNKILTVGSMILIMGFVMYSDIFAAHSSHRSHSSHSSSKSSSANHSSHTSHSSHSSSKGGSGYASHSSSSSHSSAGSYTYGGSSGSVSATPAVPAVPPTPPASSIGVPKTPQPTDIAGKLTDINVAAAVPVTPDTK